MKKALALFTILALPVGVLTACEPEADKKPVSICRKDDYRKATPAARAAGGTFFVCGGPKCKVVIYKKTSGNKLETQKTTTIRKASEFTVPRSVTWSAPNCGPIYARRAK